MPDETTDATIVSQWWNGVETAYDPQGNVVVSDTPDGHGGVDVTPGDGGHGHIDADGVGTIYSGHGDLTHNSDGYQPDQI